MKPHRTAGFLAGNLTGMRQYADIGRPAPPACCPAPDPPGATLSRTGTSCWPELLLAVVP